MGGRGALEGKGERVKGTERGKGREGKGMDKEEEGRSNTTLKHCGNREGTEETKTGR